MKNYILYIIVSCMLLFFSCKKDVWEQHYNVTGGSYKSLLEIVSTTPEYSKFYNALKSAGLDKELEKRQVMTLWIPTNETIGELPSDAEVLKKVLFYHLNIGAIYSDQFDKLIIEKSGWVKSFNGKYLHIDSENSGFIIDEAKIINTNVMAKNGVIHEIDQLLLPKLNIDEYISLLDDSYSYIKGFLEANAYRVADIPNSIPTGVNDIGQTVYDTIWVDKNIIYEMGDVSSEDYRFTAFLSSDKMIDIAITTARDMYFSITGEVMPDELESELLLWCVSSLFSDQEWDIYPADETFLLTTDNRWKTVKQEVEPLPVALSNGLRYNVTKLHIPLYKLLPSVKVEPEIYFQLTTQEQDDHYTFYGSAGIKKITIKDETTLMVVSNDNKNPEYDLYVEWDGLRLNEGSGVYENVNATPAEYNVSIRLRTWYGSDTNTLTINGTVVNDQIDANVYDSGNRYRTRDAGTFILEGDSPVPLTFKLEHNPMEKFPTTRQRTQLGVDYIELVPTQSDYNY